MRNIFLFIPVLIPTSIVFGLFLLTCSVIHIGNNTEITNREYDVLVDWYNEENSHLFVKPLEDGIITNNELRTLALDISKHKLINKIAKEVSYDGKIEK